MKPQITASIDARMIYERLEKAAVGEVVTYAELTALIGSDVQTSARGYMDTARRIAHRDKNMVFASVHGVGLKRLDDMEKVKTGEGYLNKIRRTARRAARVVVSVDNYDALPNDLKVKHNAYASMFGAVAQFSGRGTQKRLEGAVQAAGQKISFKNTLALFQGQ